MQILIDGLKLGVAILIAIIFVVINCRIFIKLFVYPDTKIIDLKIPDLVGISKRLLAKKEDK